MGNLPSTLVEALKAREVIPFAGARYRLAGFARGFVHELLHCPARLLLVKAARGRARRPQKFMMAGRTVMAVSGTWRSTATCIALWRALREWSEPSTPTMIPGISAPQVPDPFGYAHIVGVRSQDMPDAWQDR